jgi:[acyl-carrier-protein] S-malonyltransferase
MNMRDKLGDKVAFVFPGQGSQTIGMGKALFETSPAAREVLLAANDELDFDLTGLCFDGPAGELEDTYNAQPAIFAVSIAALEALKERAAAAGERITPIVVAGHSLGEFTALTAAGVLEFKHALHLVRERGRLMREAGVERPGGMAAIIGLDEATLEQVCRDSEGEGIINVANDNCPGQTVISGEVAALLRAMDLAKERGARRVARLGVSIASHSPLMSRVSTQLGDLIGRMPLRTPHVPIIGNVTGQALTSVDDIRHELKHHVERPVNWTRSVREMVDDGATTFVELGPGTVLSGLIRRINKDVRTVSLGDLGIGVPAKPVESQAVS